MQELETVLMVDEAIGGGTGNREPQGSLGPKLSLLLLCYLSVTFSHTEMLHKEHLGTGKVLTGGRLRTDEGHRS